VAVDPQPNRFARLGSVHHDAFDQLADGACLRGRAVALPDRLREILRGPEVDGGVPELRK
jgi:hypothetical protein